MKAKTNQPATEDTPVAVPLTTPMTEPEGGWPADEFTGIGGTYIRDPITGLRRPLQLQDEQPTE